MGFYLGFFPSLEDFFCFLRLGFDVLRVEV